MQKYGGSLLSKTRHTSILAHANRFGILQRKKLASLNPKSSDMQACFIEPVRARSHCTNEVKVYDGSRG